MDLSYLTGFDLEAILASAGCNPECPEAYLPRRCLRTPELQRKIDVQVNDAFPFLVERTQELEAHQDYGSPVCENSKRTLAAFRMCAEHFVTAAMERPDTFGSMDILRTRGKLCSPEFTEAAIQLRSLIADSQAHAVDEVHSEISKYAPNRLATALHQLISFVNPFGRSARSATSTGTHVGTFAPGVAGAAAAAAAAAEFSATPPFEPPGFAPDHSTMPRDVKAWPGAEHGIPTFARQYNLKHAVEICAGDLNVLYKKWESEIDQLDAHYGDGVTTSTYRIKCGHGWRSKGTHITGKAIQDELWKVKPLFDLFKQCRNDGDSVEDLLRQLNERIAR